MSLTRRERIIQKVRSRTVFAPSPEGIEGDCHLWTGGTSGEGRRGGYPRMCLDGATMAVHRVVYTHYNGIIAHKKQIDHKCKNRLCVNPDHLEMVTHKENQRRRDSGQ